MHTPRRLPFTLTRLASLATLLLAALALSAPARAQSPTLPPPDAILEKLRLANAYFMAKWPDPGKSITTNRTRPSNIWTRGVYYEGLMALHTAAPDQRYYDYAVAWGEAHKWGLRNGTTTRNADDQCCGQTYLDLYLIDRKPERIRNIKTCIDAIVASDKSDDWSWIDAAQMGMPVFAKLGVLTGDPKYFSRMHDLFLYMKNTHGDHGLFNPAEGLWWRDKDFDPPYAEPNGKNCYWSRGNGWVVAAMVRVLDVLPANSPHRTEYVTMLQTMCEALRKVQRDDGFWNVSLHDPTHFGGKETSGTALFVYGMAWGVRHGVLDTATYRPVIAKAWGALSREAVQSNGFLGYVQGTGKEPKDGQPVGIASVPDFEDYGLGCFLLAGTEVWRLVRAPAK
ncbi:MAG: glycoside hydrolase family 88 protein [Verrucomicrobia bacterium]|nr:glycoside hydrolase family 88 protein [Verrucomicrobiota bacterium]